MLARCSICERRGGAGGGGVGVDPHSGLSPGEIAGGGVGKSGDLTSLTSLGTIGVVSTSILPEITHIPYIFMCIYVYTLYIHVYVYVCVVV